MKQSKYLLLLCVSAAAGTAAGVISEPKNTLKAGLMGAAAGLVAGSVAAGVYEYIASREKFPYYSESSALYDEI